jgi:hypothetical protein
VRVQLSLDSVSEQGIIKLMNKFDKLVIADEILETAIELFLDDKKYFQSLHLAGAVQEIYGKWIRINGGKDHTSTMLDQYEKLSNEEIDRKLIKREDKRPKNSIKHIDNKNDRYALLNPELDSLIILSEAVTEHMKLKRTATVNTERFITYFKKTLENGL